jgi:hypothetical protein
VSKTALSRMTFHPLHPILLVGDERGDVLCLKLSPNLRKKECQQKNSGRKVREAVGEAAPPPPDQGTRVREMLTVAATWASWAEAPAGGGEFEGLPRG